ncbi:MAG: YhcH/YjgK/YiaL family protein [Planctomycetota bacterium]|jgi:YhcH/YjgK/YiaL family protein|nr:YhcH/YjgK/YiaL family protein [Planctomycetota bacterium]
MIIDNLYSTLCSYANLDSRLATALEWLRRQDLSALPRDTRLPIDGDRIYALAQSYSTQDPGQVKFESHRLYIDLQLVVEGREIIFWTPLARLEKISVPYDFAKDTVFYEDPASDSAIPLAAGDFAVLFPSDGHKPRCWLGAAAPVSKVVVKIAVN